MSIPISITNFKKQEIETNEINLNFNFISQSPSLIDPLIAKRYEITLITGNSNFHLTQKIGKKLNSQISSCEVGRFADGEINLQVSSTVRGCDVFVIQSTCSPVNENLLELLLLLHTLHFSSPKRVTAVIPYFGYARQCKKTHPRVPISTSAVAQLIETMAPHRIVTVDLHRDQIVGCFHKTPLENLRVEPLFVNYLLEKKLPLDKVVIVSGEAKGVEHAQSLANKIGAAAVVTVLKRRTAPRVVTQMQIAGDVKGCICVLLSDIVDSAVTFTRAAALLKENGAEVVYACATHGLFTTGAIERINASPISEICVTDSIPQQQNLKICPKLKIISLANLIAESIRRLHTEQSLFTINQ
eukprot:TRINITY_DN807_c0_g2_i1.p1 TRINITY_DN807_c0_g2~~TRINITY_DN807_c0_g2_i1.p1  ORF type:complete len:357 (-),score=160.66 TRINITY_DN807_c0_g2_i1:197-1267(-)